MKITLLSSALVAIVGLAFIGAPVIASAQTTTNATAPAAPAKEKKKSDYTQIPKGAKISSIDATTVTITTTKGDVKLLIDATTGFEVNKKKATAADFAAGDEVTGSYKTAADGTNTAHNLRKKTEAAAAPAQK